MAKYDKEAKKIDFSDKDKIKKALAGMSPQEKMALAKASAIKKIKETVQKTADSAKGFSKEVIKKYKKELMGIIVLPPRPQELEKPESKLEAEVLVLLDLKSAKTPKDKYDKKQEIDKALKKLADKKLKGTKVNSALIEEVWEMCFKGKYEILQLIAMGEVVHDSGWIGSLKAVELHKVQVLRKFEKYVVSYVIGGSLIRGEATTTSDVDTFVVIDDTDVTRMTSSELKQKLTSIIWGMASEAQMAAGVKNKLNIQIYVLSDMWNSIKNAEPVIFTFLRDGVPLYDRGMFTPWKLLLKKGKITPSPEAVDGYLKTGAKILDRVKLKIKDIAVEDFFWSTIYPSQGILMLAGIPPGAPSEVAEQMRNHLVKPGYLEEKWIKIFEKNLKIRKDIEHGKTRDVDPKIIAQYLEDSEKYLARLEKAFKQIEKDKIKEELEDLYDKTQDDVQAAFKMAGSKVTGKNLARGFESELVNKNLSTKRYLNLLKRLEDIRKHMDTTRQEIATLTFEQDKLSRDTFDIISAEKGTRIDKFKISAQYNKGKHTAGIWLFTDVAFIIMDSTKADTKIKKFKIDKNGALSNPKSATVRDIDKKLTSFPGTPTQMTKHTIESLKKILANDLKIVIGA